jgi:hypothetical protein
MTGMRSRVTRCGLALLLACAVPVRSEGGQAELVLVTHNRLCLTEGTLESLSDTRFSVRVAKLRAVLSAPGPQVIEARFSYLGQTGGLAPLRSGAMRQQFGLKLRAADGCNLIYAMWRFAPQPSLVVSVKSNPGLHASSACGNSGYRTVNPRYHAPVDAPQIGASHRLAAALDGGALRVTIDDKTVWEGELGPEALAADGPVGIRSDNARLDLELFAAPGAGQGSCPKSDGAEGE